MSGCPFYSPPRKEKTKQLPKGLLKLLRRAKA